MTRLYRFGLIGLAMIVALAAPATAAMDVWATSDGVRVDPLTGKYLEDRTDIFKDYPTGDYQTKNAVWDAAARSAKIYSGRNEYAAFQVIVESKTPLRGVKVRLDSLKGPGGKVIKGRNIALFSVWYMNVIKPSRGYEKTGLGPGWYADVLIPSRRGDAGAIKFNLPNPLNHIGKAQTNQTVWVDIFIPKDRKLAPPGIYKGQVIVTAPRQQAKTVNVELKVWDFEVPDEIHCKGDIWNGSLKKMEKNDPAKALRYYQMAHQHRFNPGVAGYRPKMQIKGSKVIFDWTEYDRTLSKYFDGSAFTAKYNYHGPGFGQPIPHILLPFNCNKPNQKGGGWPVSMPLLPEGQEHMLNPEHVGKREPKHGPFAFRNKPTPEFEAIWLDACKQIKEHFDADPTWSKVRRIVFLGRLDESHRSLPSRELMIYYSKLLRKGFGKDWFDFRIDGGYNSPYMRPLAPYVDLWVCHTAGWHHEKIENFSADVEGKRIEPWFYGPLIYERPGNSGCGSNTLTDLDLLSNRGIGWCAWKLKSGYCEWEFDAHIVRSPRVHRPKKPWVKEWTIARNCRWKGGGGLVEYNGSGLLILPGLLADMKGIPLPTIRLKAQRRGMQDCGDCWLLREAGKGKAADELVDSVVLVKPFGGSNYRNPNIWKHNPEAWDEARIKAGEMLDKLAKEKPKAKTK